MKNESNKFIKDFKAEKLLEYVEEMVNNLKFVVNSDDTITLKSILHDYIANKFITSEQVSDKLK